MEKREVSSSVGLIFGMVQEIHFETGADSVLEVGWNDSLWAFS